MHKPGKVQMVLGGIVLVAILGYALGLYELPDFKEIISDAGETLGKWTYLLVGALAFLETGAFVGLIAPGETAIIVGGVVAGQGEINIIGLIALVWFCAVAGDSASFFLGRRLGREFMLKHGPRFQITHERLETVEAFFAKHGGKTILIGRFVGLVRAVAPFIAGASKMPYRSFLPYDILGAGIWATFFCLLGYIFWESFDQVADYATKGAFTLGTIITITVATIWLRRTMKDDEKRAKLRAWLHEQAQKPLLKPLAKIVRPLVFRVALPAGRRAEKPARFTYQRLTPGDLGLELTTLIGLVAVGGYTLIAVWAEVHGGGFVWGDERTLRWADDIRSSTLDDVARVVTHFGDGIAVYSVGIGAAIIVSMRGRIAEAVALIVAMVSTTLIVHAIKGIEDRDRPLDGLVDTVNASFPSGHAASGVMYIAIAVVLARALPHWAYKVAVFSVAVAVAAGVGISRVYLRAHYLSDVLAGWSVAFVVLGLAGIAALLVGYLRNNQTSEVTA